MTFEFPAPPTSGRTRFDSGPLSWVMDEIREALNQSRTALLNAAGNDSEANATLLNHAGAYLHQAHGALQIVDVDGAIIITEAVEDILRRISAGQIALTHTNRRVIEHAYQALNEYLEELLSGEPPQPIKLFPYYKELQEIRGAERVHPADLFFPNLEAQTQYTPRPTAVPDEQTAKLAFSDLRSRFESALLVLLTTNAAPDNDHALVNLRNVTAEIKASQTSAKSRDFWWVMHGFADMIVAKQVPVEQFAKLVCCRMNRQIKLWAQGSSSTSDRLLLDALYCIALEDNPLPHIEQIRNAYQLHELIPPDFEKKRYGQIDFVAVGLAKSALTQAKNTLPRATRNETGAPESFASLIRQLIAASKRLNSPPLAKLLKALESASEKLPQSANSSQLGLEIATDLLFIENTLDHLNRLSDDFPQHVDALVSRLDLVLAGGTPHDSAAWLDNLAQQSQQRQAIATLSVEMESGIRQVERMLDEYFKDPSKHAFLDDTDAILHQIAGVLSIVGQEDAMLAVQHTQSLIRDYKETIAALGNDSVEQISFPPAVTQNITALGFFIEVLPHHPESAKTRFSFDSAQGILHANLLERGVPRPSALTTADPSYDSLLDVDDGTLAKPNPSISQFATPSEPTAAIPATEEEIDAELLEIFMSEAEDVLNFVKQAVPTARENASDQDQLSTLRRSFHTLKGSGRMVGLNAFADAAYSVEQVMNLWLAEGRNGSPDLFALLERSVDELSIWVVDLRTSGKSNRTSAMLAKAAERVKAGQAPLFDAPDQASHSATSDTDVGIVPFNQSVPTPSRDVVIAEGAQQITPHQQESILPHSEPPSNTNVIDFPTASALQLTSDDNVKHIGNLEISVPLFNIFVAEADDLLRYLSQDFSEWRHEPNRPVTARAIHAAHSLAGSSATVGLSSIQEIALVLERYLQTLEQQPMALSSTEFDALQHCIVQLKQMMQQVALSELPDAQPTLFQLLHKLQQQAATPAAAAPTLVEADDSFDFRHVPLPIVELQESFTSEFNDDNQDEDEHDAMSGLRNHLDPDLFPVFLEEARELLPNIGRSLRSWLLNPADPVYVPEILRDLHTAKGSARMAGAMTLGQHFHLMETHIENILSSGVPTSNVLDDLLARHDHNLQLLDHLQNPENEYPAPVDVPLVIHAQQVAATVPPPSSPPQPGSLRPTPAAPVARVRVRADILDRLVNQAGEVSIARSKIENEVDTLRGSLSDLTENLSRLRTQLREVEIQAESQIASHAQSTDRDFDPLEFDRFSRLQELTRMMTESVEDVASIQDSLVRTVSGATTDLASQAQLTRSLQQDLMQVRMVPFASISERLYQVTRQTSKEVGKAVSLDIRGTTVEVDRGVLERMSGPLEHLLRNAIVHGIESRSDRRTAGKKDTGELLVEIRQEGNEVVIQLSDDGKGLDLSRIREKATASGMIPKDRDLSDTELENLIFQTGFSTAGEVTELAGRGVGLDVVRAEAASLGGRVNVHSDHGKGTRFTINLPLTLAVTSVVLLSTGGNTYAIPSVLVEQVQQLRHAALVEAYNEGAVRWQNNRIPIYFLSALLGDTQSTPVVQQYAPVVILRSGIDRVAIHVDEIVGNREVVVKNIGPQLARMIGIVGATVLGSGNIVLILDPVPLAQRAAHEAQIPPLTSAVLSGVSAGAAVSDQNTSEQSSAGTEQPVQGLRKKNIVMVVDDSLTVRRVTQRFLQREGYQVILAKDGVDALERLQDVKPDVMLVDIEMPRMDGFDLIRNVRSDSRIAKTPIIMITSRTASKHRNYAMELGANEYYGKPFQENQLLESIEGFVGKESESTT